MSVTEVKVKIGLDGAAQVQAGAAAAASAVGGLGDKVARFGTGATVTGQQTAQLSAQLQDFFVQVQAGGSPLTAFIQQGSQLSAVFGGVGNAARAVGSLITPLVVALGSAAAVVGTLGYAYVAGAREQEAFRRSIALTGNAAGVTASQLNELAKAATVGTRSGNADVLAQLVSTGQVAAGMLGKATEAALRLEREGGVAIKDTVTAFADLGKTPLEALKRLNETQNFLTLSTYKQVRALQDQGKATEAARVAQEAYASQSTARMRDLESQLGLVERAWRFVAREAAGAWQAILNVGRPDTTLEKLQSMRADLAARQARGPLNDRPQVVASYEKGNSALRLQITLLAEQVKAESAAAAASSERAAAVKEGIKADDASAAALKKSREEMQRMAEAGRDIITSLALEDVGLSGDFIRKWEELNAAMRASPQLAEQVRLAQARLLEQQPFIKRGLDERAKALADGAKAQADYLKSLDKSIEGSERELQALRDQYVELTAGKSVREDLVQARLDDAAAQAAQTLQAAEAAGAGEAEYERLSRIADQLRDVASLRRNVGNATAAKDVADANAAAALKAQQEWERTAESIRDSLTDAFRRAFESGEDFGTAMAKTIGNELKARLATALSGLLADGVLNLAGLAVNSQGGGQGMGALSTANSLATLYAGGAKAYSWATGGTAATGMTADFIAGYKGATLAAGQAGPTTAGATGAMGAGSSAGSSAAWLSTWGAAIALGVYKANQDYSQGFRRDQAREVSQSKFFGGGIFGDLNPMGGMESTKADLLSKLGFSDRLADLLSGSTAVAALLGYSSPQIKNAGITGSISGGDFSGAATAQAVQKAGFVRKLFGSDDKVTDITTALPDEIGRFLDAGAAGILAKAKDYGAALGLPVDQLGSVSQAIAIKANEEGKLTEEALVEALSGYGDALVAGYADAIKPLAAVGETAAQTLQRVGAAILGVNDVLDVLGLTALQASVEGGKAALSLQDLFGGLAPLQQAAGGYLQNFYSDAERADLTLRSIGDALGDVGLAVPASRDAFRGLVDDIVSSGGLLTEAGREQFATLMGVADAFAAATVPAEELAAAADDTARAAAEAAQAIADLQRSIRDGLSQVVGEFVAPGAVAPFRAGEVQSALAGGGITASVEQILGSTRGDIVALWNAVGDEGKAAILEAYDAWQAMHDAILAADIAGIVEPLGTSADELLAAYAELTPAADNLVGAWRDTRVQVDELAAALASIDGAAAVSAIDSLRATIAQRDGLAGVISGNADRAFDLRVGQGGQRAVDMLRQREATLWAEFASTNNPAVAQAITQATLQRIALEGELQGDANAAQLDALEQQIGAAERLRDLAAEMGGFILSLQAGDLSNLGYAGRLAASESIFSASLTSGQDVQASATSLLQNAQSMFGGATGAYSDVFESVTGRLRGIGAADYTGTISEAQAQLDALAGINATAEAQIAALGELNARFGTGLDSLNVQVEAQTAAVREQVAELRALQANQERQILQFGLALTRLIEASERTAEAVESTADAVELEGAAP